MNRRFRKWVSLWVILALAVIAIPQKASAKGIQVKNIAGKTKTMAIGSTFLIQTNQKASSLKFSSNRSSVAAVSSQGLITAKKKGKATITIRNGKKQQKLKIKVKKPVGYTISKKAGNYTSSVKTTVKAKKGYTVYYAVSGKFTKAKQIKAKSSKTFTFTSTKTLKLYPVKGQKMTTAKLRKTEKKSKLRADYLYTIQKGEEQKEEEKKVPSSATPSSGTPIPPGDSQYKGDDSMAGYVEPTAAEYDETDRNTEASADAVEITLPAKAPSEKITTDTYEISKKNKLTITAPGSYILHTGDTEKAVDGLIEVDYPKGVTGTAHLILDGVHLTSTKNSEPTSDTGLITIKKSVTRIVITVKEGSVNILEDNGETGIDEDDNVSTTYTGGIVCKKIPLTINGTGTLNISSEYGNGIKATNSLKILNAKITVGGPEEGSATGHNGITGKTELSVYQAELNIHSDGDALKTTLDETDLADDTDGTLASLGNMNIDGGNYSITSDNGDGISVFRTLLLGPDKMDITTKNLAGSTEGGNYKGVKAGITISIPDTAGTISVDTSDTYSEKRVRQDSNDPLADDALHCGGSIRIDGGTLTLAAGDDGIHSDTGLQINGGTIQITESYEGLESGDITINGGEITVTARDDGFNAAGGNDASPGDGFSKGEGASQTNYQIVINGGSITVDASGDGIDSNGNIFFRGGTVTVNGPENAGNGALDYGDNNCVCEISGGTLIAAGAVGMDAAPTSGSSQPAVNVRFGTMQAPGTYVALKDSNGTIVISAQLAKKFQSVILSCEALKLGETYTVYYGASENSLTQYTEFTFNSVSVSAGINSNAPGGGWNPGGGPR
ncbi:MAG: carbohydrate-binding domain-containing protein [Lachnospiraceae bacterium]|nr:carbohydrate-binding domain-containing protein [Lachnospiraceae bacterium]